MALGMMTCLLTACGGDAPIKEPEKPEESEDNKDEKEE